MKHSVNYRVYYENTDAGGIMYHGDFVNFCERARTDFMRDIGHSCIGMHQKNEYLFVIRHLEADYLKPVYLEDLLTVESWIEEIKNSSFIMGQRILREDEIVFDAKVTAVCVNMAGRPIRVPDDLRHDITTFTS